MNVAAEAVHEPERRLARADRARGESRRALAVRAIGPLTSLAGVVWAVFQPWRITLLHPHHQGFWWLFSEPPIFVVLVGVFFAAVIAPGLREDLDAAEG